jgi:hypothetical protein
MIISGLTQYLVTVLEGSQKRSYKVGAMSKEGLANELGKVYDRFTVNELEV